MGNDKGKVVVATGPSRTATLAVMLLQRLLFVVLVSLASLPVAAWACEWNRGNSVASIATLFDGRRNWRDREATSPGYVESAEHCVVRPLTAAAHKKVLHMN